MRRAAIPMTAREIADRLIAEKAPQATRKQAIDIQTAIVAALLRLGPEPRYFAILLPKLDVMAVYELFG